MAARAGRGINRAPGGARRGRGGRRHTDHAEAEGSERWLVTYADVLTLLLVLFIVLFSISVVNTSKFISLKTSLASAFGSGHKSILDGGNGLNENEAQAQGQQLVMPGVPVQEALRASGAARPADARPTDVRPHRGTSRVRTFPARVVAEVHNFTAIERAIRRALAREGMSGSARFAIDRRGLIITVITNDLVFPGNSAHLLPGGQRILSVIAPPLAGIGNSVEVDGYTNQVNVSTYPYPSGWELSSARASAVVRFLVDYGVAENRLSAVGYSDQHPLYPPSDPRAVTLNRRVEVVVRSSLPDFQAAQLPAAAAAAN